MSTSIEDLLASVIDESPSSEDGLFGEHSANSFENMFIEEEGQRHAIKTGKGGPVPEVDLSIKEFKPIEKNFLDEPADYFDDSAYYKTAIAGEGQASNRLHAVLSKYLACQDIKDKMVFRQQVIMAYWEVIRSIAPKASSRNFPMPKRMMLRFAVLLPSLFRPEHRELFSKTILDNDTGEPVFYLDEWFKYIGQGKIKPSTTDEVRQKKGPATPEQEAIRLQQLQSKNSGRLQTSENMLNMAENQRISLESDLKNKVDELCRHEAMSGLE
ncbi:MAG: hypothetical protein K2H67_00070, partial [Treponemataceae bacterium]|nr:hypothetical protein [Treponemataceae bacterium]